ncbi:hypothetical protein PSAB6_150029 [Paraburkholderia sabiae]|nr:hypothetical protein PSAB6_150029 [Paraburkholderia sabiae]
MTAAPGVDALQGRDLGRGSTHIPTRGAVLPDRDLIMIGKVRPVSAGLEKPAVRGGD